MTSAAWRNIQSLRARPTGLATTDPRKRTFAAALRQAEELALAADAVSYAAKPLPLFYSLSQAGRAIAAAHLPDRFELEGQGIQFRRTTAGESAELAARTGETDAMGLFFGPTNVNIWRIAVEVDGDDPGRAAEIAHATNPATITAGCRQVFYYADAARAYARLRGKDREAIRYLLTAERIAPQHVHSSSLARETTRALLERSQQQAGGTQLRALCERMQVS